ncbi:MAG: hypothetical protein HY727_20650 [Candidatus Rokubacteria bacterium]|nr:hypothetical protein [Candidatus Rokubacteria bacterium]
MALDLVGHIELPAHSGPGGFDHAAVHQGRRHLWVAHTANDALDLIDCATHRYLGSVGGLKHVAGTLVSEPRDLVFTSNRGEDTVGLFTPGREGVAKVKVGIRPNGLAHDPGRNVLIAANVGDPGVPGSFTVSVVDGEREALVGEVPVPGRTRWAVFHEGLDAFFVNIAAPPEIVVIEAGDPRRVARTLPVPAAGPHGLDLDPRGQRLFCACDAGVLVCLDARSGEVLGHCGLSGVPDVVLFNPALDHLYVAVGDPGVIDVVDTVALRRVETVPTEPGAHTLAFDPVEDAVFAFLPDTHRAAVYRVGGGSR